MSELETYLSKETLNEACKTLLRSVGVPKKQAAVISEIIVEADLRGIGSHGVLRLPSYIHRILAGTMTATTEVKILKEKGATLLMDAQSGFGQVAATFAMEKALDLAGKYGIGFVAVRNSGHFGIAAHYAMMALPHKMIGMVSANAAPSMAPWGGTVPLLGTNPICVTIPTGGDVDIVLDMASSIVARGKIRLAQNLGEKIPTDWALDSQGIPTNDPASAMKGTLLPIGGPKGYGLALIVDILSGVLTGSSFGKHVVSTLDYDQKSSAGFVVQAINIAAFVDTELFFENIQSLVNEIRNSPCAPGVERIYLPGEIEWLKCNERLETGIPVPDSVLSNIKDLAKELNLDLKI